MTRSPHKPEEREPVVATPYLRDLLRLVESGFIYLHQISGIWTGLTDIYREICNWDLPHTRMEVYSSKPRPEALNKEEMARAVRAYQLLQRHLTDPTQGYTLKDPNWRYSEYSLSPKQLDDVVLFHPEKGVLELYRRELRKKTPPPITRGTSTLADGIIADARERALQFEKASTPPQTAPAPEGVLELSHLNWPVGTSMPDHIKKFIAENSKKQILTTIQRDGNYVLVRSPLKKSS